jgi:hypothetical protein
MKEERDAVEQIRLLHRRTIRRGTLWWLDAFARVQNGDFDLRSWLDANTEYLEGVRKDLGEILEQLPLEARDEDSSGGKRR